MMLPSHRVGAHHHLGKALCPLGGQITDVQQPRYGQQVMDVLLPF